MYGRGTSDMKGGTAAIVVAAERIAALGEGAAGLELVLCAGEETGCEGALALTGAWPLRRGAGGRADHELPVRGAQGRRVGRRGRAREDRPRLDAAPGRERHLQARARRRAAARTSRWRRTSTRCSALPTVSLGTFSGGININSVPDYATAGIDVRTVPGMDGDSVLAALRERLGDEV